MQKNFKFTDIKSGMIVIYKCGNAALVVNNEETGINYGINENNSKSLNPNYYNNDTFEVNGCDNSIHDIIAVLKPKDIIFFNLLQLRNLEDIDFDILWYKEKELELSNLDKFIAYMQ